MITKNTKNTSGPKMKTSSIASFTSSKSTFPEIPFAARAQRPPRAAAQPAAERFHQPHSISPSPKESPMLENLELAYPEPDTPVEEDAFVPTIDSGVLRGEIPAEEDSSAPTIGIPALELAPIEKEVGSY
jgi:hypothetical protein